MTDINSTPLLQRIFSKVVVLAADDCWLWTGSMDSKGYGQVYYQRRTARSHRVVYELCKGEIPDGLLIRHSCDNPSCCNPKHLLAGTQTDNMRDMSARLRGNSVKLDDSDVLNIRRLYLECGMKQKEIAEKYGVSRGAISSAVSGKNWARLGFTQKSELSAIAFRNKSRTSGLTAPRSKMTEALVRSLRLDYTAGGITYRELAERHAMSTMAVYCAVTYKTWKQLE